MTVKSKRRDQMKKPDVGAKLNALPLTFKFAAETLKMMSERGGSAGSIVCSKFKNYNYKLIYALVMNTLKNIRVIKKIIHETKLMKKVTENDPFLLEILVGDLLFGRGLKSVEQNSTATAIMSHKTVLVKQYNLLKKDIPVKSPSVEAKYLRINHLKTNLEQVQSQLKTVGLKQVSYSKEKIKFKKFINKFKSLENDEYMLDFHFPGDLIVLKQSAVDKLKKTDLISKGKAMLQDKASFLAVEALEVSPNQKVIDACCAPGCKTTLIANKMKNKGKILAYDADKKRLISAIHLLKVQGVKCAKTEVQDFSKLKLKRLLKTLGIDKFDSILIDPSCSGSGISSRVDYKASYEEIGRLKKLQAFQVSLLKHALKADVSKSIVYCTCSQSVEENEQAIEMALNESGLKDSWNVAEVLPYWPHRGEANYEFGSKCLRSDENELTNGFFIAKLVRNQDKVQSTTNEKGSASLDEDDEAQASGGEEEVDEDEEDDKVDEDEENEDEDQEDEDADEDNEDDEEEDYDSEEFTESDS